MVMRSSSTCSLISDRLEGLSQRQRIRVTPTDPGRSGPQFGVSISLNNEQDHLIMHFPIMGYEVVSASTAGKL